MQQALRTASVALVALAFLCCEPRHAGASLVYSFETEAGDSLLRMTLAKLPATNEDIERLTFSALGNATFGLGTLYQGSFVDSVRDSHSGTFVSDGQGGLQGTEKSTESANVFDANAPISSFYQPTKILGSYLTLSASRYPSFGLVTYTLLEGSPGDITINTVPIRAVWRLVAPEPSAITLILILILALGTLSRWRPTGRPSTGAPAG